VRQKIRSRKNRWKRIGLILFAAVILSFTQLDGISALADSGSSVSHEAGSGSFSIFRTASAADIGETDETGDSSSSDESGDDGADRSPDGNDGSENSQESDVCAHSHTELVGAVEATCLETGYTGDLICLDCGAVLEYGEEIPLIDHVWDEGTVTQEADCTTAGSVTYTCTVCGSVRVDAVSALGHDYSMVEYVSPKSDEDGYALYECTRCGDSYTQLFAATGSDDDEIIYGDISDAGSKSLTFYVGYFGMSYVQKSVVTLDEILANCVMVTQVYSYIDKSDHVVYDRATGPLFSEVLDYAGIDTDSIDRFRFATADSGDSYFGGEYTWDLIFQKRYYYPLIGEYFSADGFTDITEATSEEIRVQPMLAVWDSWLRYGYGEGYDASNHVNLKATNCFRLMYGQTTISEVDASSSAHSIHSIYIQYEGSPTIDAGDDLELSISEDYQMSANINTADDTLTEAYQEAVVWSSSDESVVQVDSSTGQITVVGEGTATITASAVVGGLTISDSLTVTVTAGEEDLSGGGEGDGSGTGSDDEGDGSGTGTGEGDDSGTGDGDSEGSGAGTDEGDGSGTEDGDNEGSGTGSDEGDGSDDGGGGSEEPDDSDAGDDDSGHAVNPDVDDGNDDDAAETDDPGADDTDSDDTETTDDGDDSDAAESDSSDTDTMEASDSDEAGQTGSSASDSQTTDQYVVASAVGQPEQLVSVYVLSAAELAASEENTESSDDVTSEEDSDSEVSSDSEETQDAEDVAEETVDGEESGTEQETGLLLRSVSVGEGGGGSSGEGGALLLTMTEYENKLLIGILTAVFFGLGCVIMTVKYKKEL